MKKATLMIYGMILVTAMLIQTGCGGDSDSGGGEKQCSVGAEDCECTADGACNAGLTCKENVCVMPSDEDTETDTGPDLDTGPGRDTNPAKSDIAITNDGAGKLCAEGVVVGPSSDDGWGSHWGAGMGINLCQDASNGDKINVGDCPRDLSNVIGFRLTVTGDLPSELRIQYEDDFEGDDDMVGDNGYIVAESTDTPADYLFEDAAVLYLSEDSRPTLDPQRFTSIQFQIASHMGEIENYSFCIEDIEVILGEGSSDTGMDTDSATEMEPDTEVEMDGGVPEDAGSDMDASMLPAPADPSTDPACADPDSLSIIPNESNWVAGCSNAGNIQGDLYSYSDPG